MPDDRDRLLARLVVEGGYLTRDEVTRYWQSLTAGGPSLVMVLVRDGRLTQADVVVLKQRFLEAQGNAPAQAPPAAQAPAQAPPAQAPPAQAPPAQAPPAQAPPAQAPSGGDDWESNLQKDSMLARVLLSQGSTTQDRLRECRQIQLEHRMRLGVVLVRKGYVDKAVVEAAIAAVRQHMGGQAPTSSPQAAAPAPQAAAPAPQAAAPAAPPAFSPVPGAGAAAGFSAAPQGGFGAPQGGGFTPPPTGGFGPPPAGGYGPPTGGFGPPAGAGFGAPANTGAFQRPETGAFDRGQAGFDPDDDEPTLAGGMVPGAPGGPPGGPPGGFGGGEAPLGNPFASVRGAKPMGLNMPSAPVPMNVGEESPTILDAHRAGAGLLSAPAPTGMHVSMEELNPFAAMGSKPDPPAGGFHQSIEELNPFADPDSGVLDSDPAATPLGGPGAFGAPGAFGDPPGGGFGAPAGGAFGDPGGGFGGPPAAGGFGDPPAGGGFGGAPAGGGFGGAPAGGGFGDPPGGGFGGAPAGGPGTGFGGAPASGAGFGQPPSRASGLTPTGVPVGGHADSDSVRAKKPRKRASAPVDEGKGKRVALYVGLFVGVIALAAGIIYAVDVLL